MATLLLSLKELEDISLKDLEECHDLWVYGDPFYCSFF
jgi:hypothetical protein